MLIENSIEKHCKTLLQKNLAFEINNKTIKKGKLILFVQRNFHVTFILENDKNGKEKLEIPVPFFIESYPEDNLLFFDYRIATLCKMFKEAENHIKIFSMKKSKSKFFDSILTIYEK